MANRVLINVFDNDGIIDFAKNLAEKFDFEVVATDKSYDFIAESGINAQKFDWNNGDFDIVICNFFPLAMYKNKDMDEAEILKNFDTEGLSILQKFAKKYDNTLVVTSPSQYKSVETALKNGISDDFRKEFAKKAMFEICKVNSDLVKLFDEDNDYIFVSEAKTMNLAYGENPHQKAELYTSDMLNYEVIANREISYNNILDINLATAIASEFYDVNAAVITRHAMPCAVALGSSLEDAYSKAVDCDPVSAFGGVAAFSKKVDVKLAKMLTSMFLEVIIAPDFDEEALEMLKEKNLKLIKILTPLKDYKSYLTREIIKTPFGTLVQDVNDAELAKNTFKVVSKKKPTAEMVEDMVFAWKVSKYTRSNSAVVVKNMRTVGISQGQPNRIDAIDSALDKACENSKDAVLATDGFISTIDGIYDAAQARIAGIIQPAGSKRDKEVVAAVDKYEMTMITTGLRQFKNK